MSGRSGDSQRFVNQVCKRRQQAIQTAIGSLELPLFIYSYSSRGFPDFSERYLATKGLAPTHLVSLYDLHYHLGSLNVQEMALSPSVGRFLDSGRYEVATTAYSWGVEGEPGKEPWTEELYTTSANRYVQPGDILVSFDDPALPLVDQIKQGLTLFEHIKVPEIKRNLLLHPNGASPESLAESIAPLLSHVDLIGLTEKDLGSPWFVAVEYVRQFRKGLDAVPGRYIPIHIFGCLDPRTLPYLFFAGADVFDGLAWMRYYFHTGHTLYAKEFEYEANPTLLDEPKKAIGALLANNIEELEKLRSDLRYAILTTDMVQFEECLDKLQALEAANE
jgi:hypothetical protein